MAAILERFSNEFIVVYLFNFLWKFVPDCSVYDVNFGLIQSFNYPPPPPPPVNRVSIGSDNYGLSPIRRQAII